MIYIKLFGCAITTVWMHHLDAISTHEEKSIGELHNDATCGFKQILEATSHKTAAARSLISHLTN